MNREFRKMWRAHSAFTLIELLVVVATVALLAVMLLPALASSKVNSQSFQCMNNLRQVTTAWRMYADDNSDKAVNNFTVPALQAEILNRTFRNWVNNIMGWGTNGSLADSITNLSYIRNGIFSQYLKSTAVYKCPSDVYVSPIQQAAGWTSRTRSFSMNAYLGPSTQYSIDAWAQGKNMVNQTQRQWLKLSEVPRPSDFFVMIEEHPDSISDGWFHIPPLGSPNWDDLAASYHDGACNLTFCDGHAETHKWRSSRTVVVPFSTGKIFVSWITPTPDLQAKNDLEWIQARSSVPY